jgi:hypothetical protein
VLAARDPTGVGGDPMAAHHVGLDGGEPAPGDGLVGEGRVSGDLFAESPVARPMATTGSSRTLAK